MAGLIFIARQNGLYNMDWPLLTTQSRPKLISNYSFHEFWSQFHVMEWLQTAFKRCQFTRVDYT